MNNKKADISIYVIFSITITVAALLLLFIFIGQNSQIGKKIYCRTLYDGKANDEFCEEYLSLAIDALDAETRIQDAFLSGKKTTILKLDPGDIEEVKFSLPKHAVIKDARLSISLSNQTIDTFGSGRQRELNIIPPGSLATPVDAASIIGPDPGARILAARLEVSGAEFPSKADIAFVIDTSRSMSNEWQTVCNNLNYIKSSLANLGLDTRISIYSLGSGIASQSCVDITLTKADLMTIRAMPEFDSNSNHKCGGIYCINPYDDYEECWAVGTSYLARNHPWRFDQDVKRIIIPISDSDPTGGGPITNNGGIVTGQGVYVDIINDETDSVLDAIADCTQSYSRWIYILPIEGDEPGPNALPFNNEGYGVGTTPCTGTCLDIKSWMSRMMNDTTTRNDMEVISFQNKSSLFDAIFKIITTPFPSQITMELGGNNVWNFALELNQSNSPQVVDSTAFFDTIDGYCRGSPCTVRLLSSEGTIILDRLRIIYIQDPRLSYLNIGALPIDISGLSIGAPDIITDITEEVTTALDACPPERICNIPITLEASQEGAISLELEIEYEVFDLEEELLKRILECWRDSSYGKEEEGFICEEFIINGNYDYYYPITEKMLTDMIIEMNFCHVIGNSDLGCGEDDNIDFTQDIYNTDNILIEYDSVDKKIIIG